MTEEYKRLEARYNTINERLGKIRTAQAVLDEVAVSAETELRGLEIEMKAARMSGEHEEE